MPTCPRMLRDLRVAGGYNIPLRGNDVIDIGVKDKFRRLP